MTKLSTETINSVVIVSSEQRRDSVIHIHVSILSQASLLCRLSHKTEQNSTHINMTFLSSTAIKLDMNSSKLNS